MSILKAIGKSMYGTEYAISGGIGLVSVPDLSSLKWGDIIRDNGGKGIHLYVNTCCECNKNYLAGTLIFVPEECGNGCRLKYIKEQHLKSGFYDDC